MAPFEQTEKDEITARIMQRLSKTPYACSALTRLTNGTTNFVFRGTLTQPLDLSSEQDIKERISAAIIQTVIVKHATAFSPLNKVLPIDVSRCVTSSFLKILQATASLKVRSC
jgi:hypothetical protein